MEYREDMTEEERQRWAEHMARVLTTPPACSPDGQSKLGRRPPLSVLLARRRFLRWLPGALSVDELWQWERELAGDEYYAAQRSVVEAQRWAEAHLGHHVIGAA